MCFVSCQMEDGHTLFDYDVGLNDLIQILIRKNAPQPAAESVEEKIKSETADDGSTSDKENKEVGNKLTQNKLFFFILNQD